MIKRHSDITYKIHDEATNKTKIVHFDRLKKATLSPVKLDQSDESDQPSENDSDAAFEIVISPRQYVLRKPAAPDVAPKAQPEAAAAAKVKPNQSHPANDADPIQPIVEQRHAA